MIYAHVSMRELFAKQAELVSVIAVQAHAVDRMRAQIVGKAVVFTIPRGAPICDAMALAWMGLAVAEDNEFVEMQRQQISLESDLRAVQAELSAREFERRT